MAKKSKRMGMDKPEVEQDGEDMISRWINKMHQKVLDIADKVMQDSPKTKRGRTEYDKLTKIQQDHVAKIRKLYPKEMAQIDRELKDRYS